MEQPATSADSASPEERLAAFFGSDAAEAPPEQSAAVPQADDSATDETDDQAEGDEVAEAGEVEDEIDGVRVRGARDAVERLKLERESKADYTRKTQEVATMRKAAEDRLQFAEAREQITAALIQDYGALQAKQQQLKQLQQQDLGALYETSPSLAMRVQQQIQTLKDELQGDQGQLAQKAQQLQSAVKAHSEKQWSMAAEAFRQRMPSVTPAEDVAMLRQVESVGITSDEMRSRFADPRILQLVYKAAKFDALQSGKTEALSKATKAPPVLKPGATNTGAAAERRLNDARARLKKSGRVEDAAALFMRMS